MITKIEKASTRKRDGRAREISADREGNVDSPPAPPPEGMDDNGKVPLEPVV